MYKLFNIKLLKRLPLINYSTKPAIKETQENYDKQIKEFERISNISQRMRPKQPQKPPFVKNLLLGIFDADVLTYPQINNEDLDNLNDNLKSVNQFLKQPEIEQCSTISRKFLKDLGKNKLLGLQASPLMDGRALNVTESCRFIESLSELSLRRSIITNEQLGIQILNKFGSDKQKRKYLEPLITGDLLSAFCIIEANSDSIYDSKITAALSSDTKMWTLNGNKNLVINGKSADIFIVLAQTDILEKDQIKEKKYSVFVVERDFGGITTEASNTIDPKLETVNVTFINTPVPADNLIGRLNHGDKILAQVYPEYRLSLGLMDIAITRNLINKTIEYLLEISQEPLLLYETDAIRLKISELTASLYAMESVIYLTTGLMDNYENQDCEVEAAIVKIFTSEQTLQNTTSCLDLLGERSLHESHWCNQFHREAVNGLTFHESNNNLKLLIALLGLKHAGTKIKELVKKLRNPLFHAPFVLKRMWNSGRQEQDNPKLNLYLYQNLHPSSAAAASLLEYSVLRLQFATELLLSRNGQEVINKHMDLERLANCLIDIYAMTACLGRASRAYCIGLQHGDYEITLAGAFCVEATERVRANIRKTVERYQINDDNYKHIANRAFKFKKYFPEHPLTRNF